MITVTLAYPNGGTEKVLLAGVPRIGERIRLDNGPDEPSLIVDAVLWLETKNGHEPGVVLTVRHSDKT